METILNHLPDILSSVALVVTALILRKPLMKLKRISVQKLEIETKEDTSH